MLPVAVNVPATGSNSSALARARLSLSPPAISTFPLGNKVAVCRSLAVVILPAGAKLFAPLLHPVVVKVTTNMNTTVNFPKWENARFDMVPPVARDARALDSLSTTRRSLPGKDRQ
jgi:hypothetical protein